MKVYRQCKTGRVWTDIDFSGCTLTSGEQQTLVIVSLLVTSDSTEINTPSLEQQVIYSKPVYELVVLLKCIYEPGSIIMWNDFEGQVY